MLKPLHLLMNDEPGDTGTGGPAPAPEAPPAPPAPPADAPPPEAPEATPAPTAAPVDPFATLTKELDKIGTPEKPAAPPAPTPAPPPGATPAPTAAPKPAEMDLTPPEGITERAKERWAQLTERVKLVPELERRATEATTQLDNVRKMVADSGLEAHEFTDMLETGRLLKSDSPQELQKAMARLDAIRGEIALRLGVDAPGVDPLAAHPDLKADVENMGLTRERALEIAKLRAQDQRSQAVTAEQREFQKFETTVKTAAANMEKTLAARAGTPGHDAKLAHIHSYFTDPVKLQAFVKTYQPHQWEGVLTMMYDAFTPPPAAPAAPAAPQPLRPTNTRAGTPTSRGNVTAESAVMGAFDRLGL